MERVKYINPYYQDYGSSGEICVGKSETVPGASMTIAEIYRRSMSGAIIPDIQFGHFETGDDEDFNDAFESGMDFMEAFENSEKITYYEKKLKEINEAKKKNLKSEKFYSEAEKTNQTENPKLDET